MNSNLERAFYGHLQVYFLLSFENLSNCKWLRRVLQGERGEKKQTKRFRRAHSVQNLLLRGWFATGVCQSYDPPLHIASTLFGSFPFRRGLVAFVNIEKLTSGFLSPEIKDHETPTTTNVRKKSSVSCDRRKVVFELLSPTTPGRFAAA